MNHKIEVTTTKVIKEVIVEKELIDVNLSTFIGIKVKTRRKELGLTQEELGFKTKLSRPSIANIERGRTLITLNTLEYLCIGLDCHSSYFLPF